MRSCFRDNSTIRVLCTINTNRKLLTVTTCPFGMSMLFLFQEHPFSSSNNNHLTWQRSISLCTCAPSPKCLDGSAPHVRRSRHHNLIERNPGVKIKSAYSATHCTPGVHTNPSDLVQILWNLQLWNFPENHMKPFKSIVMLLSPCHLTLLQTAGL